MRGHFYLSSNGKMTTPISKHIGMVHIFDTLVMKFCALEQVPDNEMGGGGVTR